MDKIYFSSGNMKLSKSILIFSIPAVVTCPESVDCKRYCYARKAELRFPHVLECRYRNLDKTRSDDFTDSVVNILKKKKKKYVRIHESGDFYSLEYFNKWIEIIKRLPDIQFYAYTKTDWYKNIDIPSNFNIIYSFLPGRNNNVFNDIDEYSEYNKTNKVFLCPATKKKDIKIICGEDCKHCISNNKYTAFLKH